MNTSKRKLLLGAFVASQLITNHILAQQNIPQSPINHHLQHGITQYDDGNYIQAIHSFEEYLNQPNISMMAQRQLMGPNQDKELAKYYMTLAKVKYGSDDLVVIAAKYIDETVNIVYRDRVAYQLAHYYFKKNQYAEAIQYYELIDTKNLNNDEIADLKFETAYSYFVQSDFDKAYPLFAAIKGVKESKYYIPGNYYYGLLAYNKKNYDQALSSFKVVEQEKGYEDIVPYYIAEIHYFKGETDQALALSKKLLNQTPPSYYQNDLNLLTGHILFEKKQYKAALPYLQKYYEANDKIRKENLYELAYTYFELNDYKNAIQMFKPLSATQDTLGQNSMYLLGTAYLKLNDKAGAKNAFSIASSMDFLPETKRESQFLFASLSKDLGDISIATQAFQSYISTYPNAANTIEAKEHLASLLASNKNYQQAYDILSTMDINTKYLKETYQKVTLARGIQAMSNQDNATATDMLQQSLRYNEDANAHAIAQFWVANIAYDNKDYVSAEKAINTYIDQAKKHESALTAISQEASLHNAYTLLGYTQMELMQYDKAQKTFALAGDKKASTASSHIAAQQNTVLQADAAFMNKNYKDAEVLYDQVVIENSKDASYAYYQKAQIAGIKGNLEEKLNILLKAQQQYPMGAYRTQIQYEIANTYLEKNNHAAAKKELEALNKIAVGDLKTKVLNKLAYTEAEAGDPAKAISYLQEFITQYPTHPERNTAIKTLRNMYVKAGNVTDYYSFAEKNNIKVEDQEGQEMAYFEVGENQFIDSKYPQAIQSFENYLSKYPSGAHVTKAYYYIGESNLELNKNATAQEAFLKVIQSGDKDYEAIATEKLAYTSFELKQYEKAISYATKTIENKEADEDVLDMQLILLKSYNQLGNSENAFEIAKKLESNKANLAAIERQEIDKALAFAALNKDDWQAALKMYKEQAALNQGATSAEARFRIAEIYFKQGKLDDAEKAADDAIQKNSSEYFWLVKSYTLIGEVLAAQKDYFNARATLQSVINNATIESLAQEAKEKLAIIEENEKAASKIIQE